MYTDRLTITAEPLYLCTDANNRIQTTFWIRVIFRAAMPLCFCLAVAAFICVFALHGASAQFLPDSQRSEAIPLICPKGSSCYPSATIYYIYPGFFDRETWFCEIGSFSRFVDYPFVGTPDLSRHRRVCLLETGARWTSIFPVIFSAALCFLFYVDWKGDRVLIRTWKRAHNSQEWWDDDE